MPPHHQAHKNTFAFRHNPKSKLTATIAATPIVGVCEKCRIQIQWRKDYRRYKPLKAPATCTFCKQRTIKSPYHTLCKPCALDKKQCAKCQGEHIIIVEGADEDATNDINQKGPSVSNTLIENNHDSNEDDEASITSDGPSYSDDEVETEAGSIHV